MRAFVTIYSKVFLDIEDDTWSARPNNALLQRLHNGEGSARWIACISDSYISIGDPVSSGGDRKILYLPQWFMESICLEDGTEIDLDFKRSEDMPRATSLNFRMMGPGTSDLDIRDLLEEPLSQLGVLQVGQIIPVPALEGTMLVLESCEPDGIVFLHGAEIALDIAPEPIPIDEPVHVDEPIHEPVHVDDPIPPPMDMDESDFDEILPSKSRFPPKYIPFQGVGNKLGSA